MTLVDHSLQGRGHDAATDAATVRFFRIAEQARLPQRADRSGAGTLPTRASRHCDAVTAAAGFGWYLFAPLDVSLVWDGADVYWREERPEGPGSWRAMGSSACPGLAPRFDASAPPDIRGFAPAFLTALPEPGAVQVWTGLFARTAPGWSLLVRAPANLPQPGGYAMYEGIVESDRWFGPLFTNLRLTRTDIPVRLRADYPLVQAQPLPRVAYCEATLAAFSCAGSPDALTPEDWEDYRRTVVRPAAREDRPAGLWAVEARRRRRRECPHAAA